MRALPGEWGAGGLWREVEVRTMGRAALEDGLGRGSYVVGAHWDEGNMVHAMRRFGGTTMGWMEVWGRLILAGPLEGRASKTTQHSTTINTS